MLFMAHMLTEIAQKPVRKPKRTLDGDVGHRQDAHYMVKNGVNTTISSTGTL